MTKDSHRINAILPAKTYQALETLARDQGKTKTEVLRDAVSLEVWFSQAQEDGHRILVERDGEVREIIPR